MSALDDLLGEFESNAGTMPRVNPPEAAAVLATQTAPEVAGEPEPPPVEEAPPAPTEKPAEVKATEAAAKTRKPRGAKASPPAPPAQAPEGWVEAIVVVDAKQGPTPTLDGFADPRTTDLSTDLLVQELQSRGYEVTLRASRA